MPERELSVRLLTPVSSATSGRGDSIQAVLTSSSIAQDGLRLPPGLLIRGAVLDAEKQSADHGRAVLRLGFDSWQDAFGQWHPLHARVVSVDNARETFESDGTILGIAPVRERPGRVEDLLLLAAFAHPLVLAMIVAGKFELCEHSRPEIEYGKGVDLTLAVSDPLGIPANLLPPSRPVGDEVPPSPELQALVHSLPLRTYSKLPSKPSDLTNLLFLGTEDQLHHAFDDAGWSTALALCLRTEVKTFFAVAERNAYTEGPVSTLMIDGRSPDLVFQKQNNTFSKRHHIRIWKTEHIVDGRPVWIGAGTHDIGILFSREARTFTHAVEHNVDLERDKVVADLRFTGKVASVSWVDRPAAPRSFQNATGDALQTDGRMAVLILSH